MYRTENNPKYVYRIYDPMSNNYLGSSSKSLWANKSGALNTLKEYPKEIQRRSIIQKYKLVLMEDENVAA